jgi:hypothetical protein
LSSGTGATMPDLRRALALRSALLGVAAAAPALAAEPPALLSGPI